MCNFSLSKGPAYLVIAHCAHTHTLPMSLCSAVQQNEKTQVCFSKWLIDCSLVTHCHRPEAGLTVHCVGSLQTVR